MTARHLPLSRRSLVLGGAAAMSTSACAGLGFPPTPPAEDTWHFDRESKVAGGQTTCAPADGTPLDLAWAPRMMRVPEAWEYSLAEGKPAYGKDVVIGHIDTGVADHVELHPTRRGQRGPVLWEEGYDFIYDVPGGYDPLVNTVHLEQIGHGTATASVIVSRGGIVTNSPTDPITCNGTTGPGRITGTAPGAYLIPARAFRLAASSNRKRIADAIDYLACKNVDVITMALGWPDRSEELEAAIVKAIQANIIVLAAAGNVIDTVTFPAKGQNAIGIGGVGPDARPWRGSSRGKEVVVSAPADKVWRAYRDEKLQRLDLISPRFGTSFAVSLTAGVAAVWLAHHGRDRLKRNRSGKYLQEVFRAALADTAWKPNFWNDYHRQYGSGIVDARALLGADLEKYL